MNAVDWLAQDEALISIRSKDRTPPPLAFSNAALRGVVRYGNIIGVPLVVVLFGAVRLARRRARTRQAYRPLTPAAGGMSSLQLRRLAIAVVVLLALWGLSALLSHRTDKVRGALVLPALPPTLKDTIAIVHGRDTIRLAAGGSPRVDRQRISGRAGEGRRAAEGLSATPRRRTLPPSALRRSGVWDWTAPRGPFAWARRRSPD